MPPIPSCPKRDWDGMRMYFDTKAVNMNNYENNAGALLESKRLDAKSKRDICYLSKGISLALIVVGRPLIS